MEGDAIKAIFSGEKEEVKLKKEMKISGPIEQWLKKLQEEMISSLSTYMKAAQNEYPTVDRKAFVGKWPGQIVATVCQIFWCSGCVEAIDDQAAGNALALKDYWDTCQK